MAAIKEWFGLYNIMFSWFEKNFGQDGFKEYCNYIAQNCYCDEINKFKNEGLTGIREYFESQFLKDGGVLRIEQNDNTLNIKVIRCPAFEFMKSSANKYFKPISDYCMHDEIINRVISEKSGINFKMTDCDNNGHCIWNFQKQNGAVL